MKKKRMDEKELEMLDREIDLLKRGSLKNMDHPNVLKIYEFLNDKDTCMLITEIIEGGELFDEFAERSQFPEDEVAQIMKTILGCINYCHAKGIVHRDLKPENVMLDNEKSNYSKLKIIDFGLSKHFEKDSQP